MQPEVRRLLVDMTEAVVLIRDFANGKTLADFSQDKLLRSAIYFQFAVVGEALTQLRRLDDSILEQISDASKIISFRNQIIHGYAKVDDAITWNIVEQKVPTLHCELTALQR